MSRHFTVIINWLLTGKGDIFISNPVNTDTINPVTIGGRIKRIRFEKGLTRRARSGGGDIIRIKIKI
jgi:hypothetical protein